MSADNKNSLQKKLYVTPEIEMLDLTYEPTVLTCSDGGEFTTGDCHDVVID